MNLLDNDAYVGSPLKKQRASISATDENVHRQGQVAGLSSKIHEIMDTSATATSATAGETQSSQSSITNHNTSTTTANNDSLCGSLLSEGIMESDIKSPGLEEEL